MTRELRKSGSGSLGLQPLKGLRERIVGIDPVLFGRAGREAAGPGAFPGFKPRRIEVILKLDVFLASLINGQLFDFSRQVES